MGKFLINTSDRLDPTIEEYDESDVKDELRDELYDEIKEEMVADIQNAADDHEMELDSIVNRIENEIDDLLNEVQSIKSQIEDLSAETGFRVEDHI